MRVFVDCCSRQYTARKTLPACTRISTKVDERAEGLAARAIKMQGMNQSEWGGGVLLCDPGVEVIDSLTTETGKTKQDNSWIGTLTQPNYKRAEEKHRARARARYVRRPQSLHC